MHYPLMTGNYDIIVDYISDLIQLFDYDRSDTNVINSGDNHTSCILVIETVITVVIMMIM